MARQKRDVIDLLVRERLLDANKALRFPLVPLRVAVVSSSGAAGYGDFVHQLGSNDKGYCFRVALFEASMQGESAEKSLIQAIREVRDRANEHDVLVLVRGGGSKIDLHWFDSYALAKELATFPLPVITGIGHERDESVADLVAFQRCKTPTAVAEFLIRTVCEFEEHLINLQTRIIRASNLRIESCRQSVEATERRLQLGVTQFVAGRTRELLLAKESLRVVSTQRLERENSRLERFADKVGLLDPINVLRRGYSLVYRNDKLIKTVADVHHGDQIRVLVANGKFTADVKETYQDGENNALRRSDDAAANNCPQG